jgi:acid phosphatase
VLLRICSIVLACGLFAACSGRGTQQNVLPQTAPIEDQTDPPAQNAVVPMSITPKIAHITVVIMENYNYSQLIGSSAAPYLNSLARNNALFTNSHGVAHPSQPNYLALFSGSTQGVTSDACPVLKSAANLSTRLRTYGFTFQGYAENWPSSGNPCVAYPSSVKSGYLYWRKHVPWTDFSNVAYRTYGHNYGGPGTLLAGSVNFVVPNMCHDGHDCSIAAMDSWLAHNIPPIQNYNSTHNGMLIVTFDEGDNSSTNHIVTIFSGAHVVKGTHTQWINHYNVLRLIETNFGLPLLAASGSATPISGALY